MRQQSKDLLAAFYSANQNQLTPSPLSKIKSKWDNNNKWGFFLGVLEHGLPIHKTNLNAALNSTTFSEQQTFSKTLQSPTLIDALFDYYITPFHKGCSNESECNTPIGSTASSSRACSTKDLDHIPEDAVLTHANFKKAVAKRDGVCLLCWENRPVKGCHIISQKNDVMDYDEVSLFQRAGLKQKHQVQNGLLLCGNCHNEFNVLKRYFEVIGEQLVLKVVNENERDEEKTTEWRRNIRNLRGIRVLREEDWATIDRRQATNPVGEMALYFVNTNPTIQPNKLALEFHKAACLIWKMAGGAEEDEEECPDDNYDGTIGFSDPVKLARTREWQNSSATLIVSSK
ncbi:UNVERIFIED_CONTAM: hypothetical protein HDU68_011950 [Siphonaria sp. JEL0065]|nr:hypothetical protein HDU68_011950 [Siphonaria sp. JEL0065]